MAAEILTVSELNRLARQALERELPLLWVAGEISNLTRASSGHVYFSLKDEAAQVRCVMFRSRAQLIPWQIANGQQVEARALPSLYEARGDFQLTVESLRRAGLGRLFEAFARLKAKLEAEGLFAVERKRSLPTYPYTIGIVSSPQAAALQDVLASLRRRAPHLRIILYPTPVQGDGAGSQIANALRIAGQHARCDVLLLVRGGGSIEDLWAFNEELVARAIAASPIPVVAGVGHETDTTMVDFVADLRAATPTAAAELVSAHWFAARSHLRDVANRLQYGMERALGNRQQRLDDLARRLIHPAMRLAQHRDRLRLLENRLRNGFDRQTARARLRCLEAHMRIARNAPRVEPLQQQLIHLEQRLRRAAANTMVARRQQLQILSASIEHLSPDATVARGYSIVRNQAGQVITRSSQLAAGEAISLQLADGQAHARIENSVIAPK